MSIQIGKFRKLNLVSLTSKKKPEDDKLYLAFNANRASLCFSKGIIDSLTMEGQFVKFYVDSVKKVIAWKIERDSLTLEEVKTGYRIVKTSAKSGIWNVMIKCLLMENRMLSDVKTGKYQIFKYVERGLLEKEGTYYYITLN